MKFIENTKEHAMWIAPNSGIKVESFENGTCYRYSFNKKSNTIKKQKVYIYKERNLTTGNNPSIFDIAFKGTWWIRLSLCPIHASCTTVAGEPMNREKEWEEKLNAPLGSRNNDVYYFTDECDDEVLSYFISKLEDSINRCKNTIVLKEKQLSLLKNNGIKESQQIYGF